MAATDFLPDKTKVDAKNVSFVQTVLNTLGSKTIYAGALVGDVGKKSLDSPFEESTQKRRVDHAAGTRFGRSLYSQASGLPHSPAPRSTAPRSRSGNTVYSTYAREPGDRLRCGARR